MSILTALQGAKGISFTLGPVTVVGHEFLTVAGLFGDKVTVHRQVTAGATDHAAVYDPTKRTLFIYTGDPKFPSDHWQESLIVHEAVHVAGHMKRRNVTALAEEMAAHVAQAMYLVLHESKVAPTVAGRRATRMTPRLVSMCVRKSDVCSDARIAAGSAIAAAMLNKRLPNPAMLNALRSALENDTAYRLILTRPLGYQTGIP